MRGKEAYQKSVNKIMNEFIFGEQEATATKELAKSGRVYRNHRRYTQLVRISRKLHSRVREVAKLERTTMSKVVDRFVREGLNGLSFLHKSSLKDPLMAKMWFGKHKKQR